MSLRLDGGRLFFTILVWRKPQPDAVEISFPEVLDGRALAFPEFGASHTLAVNVERVSRLIPRRLLLPPGWPLRTRLNTFEYY